MEKHIKEKDNKNSKKTIKYLLIALFVVLFFAGFVFGNLTQKKLSYKYYYNGIYVDGIKVSGLTKVQARKKLENQFSDNYNSKVISLIYEEKMWKIHLGSINYRFDFDSTLNYAYNIGREGNWIERLKTINSLDNSPINLLVAAKYDKDYIAKKLEAIKKEIDFFAKPSTYNYNYGKIICTNAVEGKSLDIYANTKLIETKLLNRNYNDIFLIVQLIKPSVSLESVKALKDVLASYTTRFNINNYSRAHNIELACKKINNYLLMPGEEFSMDLALGPRTTEQGYMQAPIIIRSALVPGTGGGICQVASTLYNAVLLSMLQVTSRINHSIPPSYVPPGQDATISEGYIDFKFKNNRDYTICIVSEILDGNVSIKIVGKERNDDPVVILRPIIIEEYEPPDPEYVIKENLLDDEINIRIKEKKGLKVILYRDIYNKQGELINCEKISQDIYKPVRGVLVVNKRTFEVLNSN